MGGKYFISHLDLIIQSKITFTQGYESLWERLIKLFKMSFASSIRKLNLMYFTEWSKSQKKGSKQPQLSKNSLFVFLIVLFSLLRTQKSTFGIFLWWIGLRHGGLSCKCWYGEAFAWKDGRICWKL